MAIIGNIPYFQTNPCFLHENMARDRQGIPKVARSGARSLCLRPARKGCWGMVNVVQMHGAKRSKTKDGTTYTYIYIYIHNAYMYMYIYIYIIRICIYIYIYIYIYIIDK